MQFYFGGTSLLIVVGVAMDTVQQVESQLIMRHYDGFMKKTRIRGRAGVDRRDGAEPRSCSGPPGAGKGTQAERFARTHGHSEDLDRRHPARGGAGGHARSACGPRRSMDRGELVSDDVMIGIVRERLDAAGRGAAGSSSTGFRGRCRRPRRSTG